MNTTNKARLIKTVTAAVFCGLLCVLSPISLPLGPVPFTLTLFTITCVCTVLGYGGIVSTVLYVLMGAAGLPVFAGFKGGFGALMGQTGGFIAGYIVLSVFVAISAEKSKKTVWKMLFAFMGLICCYICGTGWFAHITGYGLQKVLTLSVFPFIIADTVKIAFAVFCGKKIKAIIEKIKFK